MVFWVVTLYSDVMSCCTTTQKAMTWIFSATKTSNLTLLQLIFMWMILLGITGPNSTHLLSQLLVVLIMKTLSSVSAYVVVVCNTSQSVHFVWILHHHLSIWGFYNGPSLPHSGMWFQDYGIIWFVLFSHKICLPYMFIISLWNENLTVNPVTFSGHECTMKFICFLSYLSVSCPCCKIWLVSVFINNFFSVYFCY